MGQNLWVLAEDAYGLWVIADLWVIVREPTWWIDFSMGYEGLWVMRGMG
jgi:hypothetical protein